LARREIRSEVEPFKKASAAHRRHIAALKRQVAILQRQVKVASRRTGPSADAKSDDAAPDRRFVAKGLKSLRARLGLSAEEFGKLVDVSGQSVYNWESKKTVPRAAQLAKIAGLRSLGKRDVRVRLEELATAAKARKRRTSGV